MENIEQTVLEEFKEKLKLLIKQTDFRVNFLKEAKRKGELFKAFIEAKEIKQKECNHRKGGYFGRIDLEGAKWPNIGNDEQYAVIKHQHFWGDTWIRCMRCGKTWKPPVKSDYKRECDYWIAWVDYKEALDFPTRNQTSTSIQINVDVEKAREATKNSI